MKKQSKIEDVVFGKKVTITIDEQLNQLKGKVLAPGKLARANKNLRKVTSLPK